MSAVKLVRRYTLGRRAEAAADTRQRLVDATAALHYEKGISATSLRDIALRAGVSIGTAYHHFPTYDDAIRACGAHTMRLNPPPDEAIFDGIRARDERVRALVHSLCAYYDRCPWIESIRLERSRYRAVEEGMAALDTKIEALVRAAVGDDAAAVATLVAVSDITPFNILRNSGLSVEEAAERISAVFLCWLAARGRSRGKAQAKQQRRKRK